MRVIQLLGLAVLMPLLSKIETNETLFVTGVAIDPAQLAVPQEKPQGSPSTP